MIPRCNAREFGKFFLAYYSDLEITPQAIRGGAPLSVELLTA